MIPTVKLHPEGLDDDDLGEYSIGKERLASLCEKYKEKAEELVQALSTVGFLYLSHHGIPEEQISTMFDITVKFFNLPQCEKDKLICCAKSNAPAHGYVPPGDEVFDPDLPYDVKEAMDFAVNFKDADNVKMLATADTLFPGFLSTVMAMDTALRSLSNKVLRLIGIGLHIEDPDFFVKSLGEPGESNDYRLLYYPKISSLSNLVPGQSRCSEHTDFGNVTLLLQDDCGGLEVQNTAGEYVPAEPREGAILVNIGDYMKMCTGGRLKSTMHKVVIPESNFSRPRYCLAYFSAPEGNQLTEPLFGKENFTPISFDQWRNEMFHLLYKLKK